jgi:signal peptidase I
VIDAMLCYFHGLLLEWVVVRTPTLESKHGSLRRGGGCHRSKKNSRVGRSVYRSIVQSDSLGIPSGEDGFPPKCQKSNDSFHLPPSTVLVLVCFRSVILSSLLLCSCDCMQSESPVVVVLSGSMEPAFQRGDILFLSNSVEKVLVGDVVVFKIKDRDIPIVHRILKVHQDDDDAKVELLTKGDNNRVDDRGLYAPGQLWLEREDILGKAVGTLRYVGMVTIALNDYPVLKYVLVGMMGLFVLTSKEG